MARILFTSIYYSPEFTGTAPYTARMAQHLAARGHDVTVLTGVPHFPQWSLWPGEDGRGRTEWLDGVRVVRVPHYVPARQSALRRARYEASFAIHGALARGIPSAAAVIGVIPGVHGGLLARFFAHRWRSPYGVIFQDLVGRAAGQSGIAGGGRVAAAATRLERWSAARAVCVAAVSRHFFPYLQELGIASGRLVHLPNWAHVESPAWPREMARRHLGWRPDEWVVLHAGNMGLKQDLGQVVAAARLARTTQPHVRFVLMGHGNQRGALQIAARELQNVTFVNPLPEREYAAALGAADVLLVTERPTVVDMSLPSKLTSYFTAGRPVVAAVRPGGATDLEVQRSGAGIIVPAGDPDALIRAVLTLASDQQLCSRLARGGERFAAAELSEHAALERADAFVAAILAARRRRFPA